MKKRYNHPFAVRIASVVFVGCFFSLLLARTFDLQVVKGDFFRVKADGNRFGDPLVRNVPKYFKLENQDSLYSKKEAISHTTALETLATTPDAVEFEIERQYLFPESTSQVLGYVGAVTAEELAANPAMSFSEKVGKAGLEKMFDTQLQGNPGSIVYEINALGQKQRVAQENKGTAGVHVTTSLDPYLSEVAYRALGDQRGSVVALDADTGDILALVSTPTYDASLLSRTGIDSAAEVARRKEVSSYFTNPLKPFFNRATSGAYPPGSVFKLITALAALEAQVVAEDTVVRDEGVLTVGDYTYANWYYTQHGGKEGDIGIVRSLARSNDIFFYKTAELLGPVRLAEYARLLGLGSRTGVELSGESAGLVPTPEWKEKTVGEKWFLGNTFHMGIGQGDLLVTPLQVASSVQAIGKRGARCAPRFLPNQQNQEGTIQARCTELGFLEENLELVVQGMLDACSPGGTGYPFFAHNAAVRDTTLSPYDQVHTGAVACKTGTSEFGAADPRGYRNTHAWFAMFFSVTNTMKTAASSQENDLLSAEDASSAAQVVAEAEKPPGVGGAEASLAELHAAWIKKNGTQYPKNIVLVVLVESDEADPFKEGSQDAAPVAKAIYDWMLGGGF